MIARRELLKTLFAGVALATASGMTAKVVMAAPEPAKPGSKTEPKKEVKKEPAKAEPAKSAPKTDPKKDPKVAPK